MKKILAIILALFLCYSCGPTKKVTVVNDQTYGYSQMYYTMNKVLCAYQVDSMIVVDHLYSLDKWPKNVIGQGRQPIIQHYFIKSLGEEELIYVITPTQIDTVYKCTKRVTKEIK